MFVGNCAPCRLSPQIGGMPVISEKASPHMRTGPDIILLIFIPLFRVIPSSRDIFLSEKNAVLYNLSFQSMCPATTQAYFLSVPLSCDKSPKHLLPVLQRSPPVFCLLATFLLLKYPFYRSSQLPLVDRLADVLIHPGSKACFPLLLESIRCHCDHRDRLCIRPVPASIAIQ